MTTASLAQTPAELSDTTTSQPFRDMYGVFISNKLTETKQFYVSAFSMIVACESTIFMLLNSPGDKPFTVGFMPENHPFVKPRLKAYAGVGRTWYLGRCRAVHRPRAGLFRSIHTQITPYE